MEKTAMKDEDIVTVTNVCFDNRKGKVIIEPEKPAKVSKSLEQALSKVKLDWIEE
jgi:predicted metal-dependent RNase